MRPLRKDLIPWLLDNPRTVVQIARECGATQDQTVDDLRHLIRSLHHTTYHAALSPARCRKCGFTFAPEKLLKPSKCPACHGTWLTEPQFCVRQAPTEPQPPPPIAPSAQPAQDTNLDPATPPDPSWLEPLDHTADAGFAITAPDLPQLFERAAWGMFSLVCDLAAVRSTQQTIVEVLADDVPALLVRWLSELNFRHVTEHRLYRTFAITDLAEGRLRACVGGEPVDLARHTVYTEIKAVTFHELEVRQDAAGWRAQVIFDL